MITKKLLLDSLEYVVNHSDDVSIDQSAIVKFSKSFNNAHIPHWRALSPFPYERLKKDEDELDFLFLIGNQAFYFWGYPNKWTMDYQGKQLDGWWALIACFKRAIEKGIPIVDGHYFAHWTIQDAKNFFAGSPPIPLLSTRHQMLKKIGEQLVEKYNGRFHHCFRNINRDAFSILDAIIPFEGFDDVTEYKGKKVYFYKKAQVVITDIYESFQHRGLGKIERIHELTGHADYKVPAILRHLGVLVYSKNLAQTVDNRKKITQGSDMEIEIRANMLWALQLIIKQLNSRFPTLDAVTLCGILWGISQKKDPAIKPYHLTPTVYY